MDSLIPSDPTVSIPTTVPLRVTVASATTVSTTVTPADTMSPADDSLSRTWQTLLRLQENSAGALDVDSLLRQLATSVPALLTPSSDAPSTSSQCLPLRGAIVPLTTFLSPDLLLASLDNLPKTVSGDQGTLETPPIVAPTPIRPGQTLLSPQLSWGSSSAHSSLGSTWSNPLATSLSPSTTSPLPSSSLSLSSSSMASAFSFLQLPGASDPFGLLERRRSAPEGPMQPPPLPAEILADRRRFSDIAVHHHESESSADFRRRHSTASSNVSGGVERKLSSGSRKQRTIYGSSQTQVLENTFNVQRYMVGSEREQLATRLGLSESQVRVWFQNRRSKQRKQSKTSTQISTMMSECTPVSDPSTALAASIAAISTGGLPVFPGMFGATATTPSTTVDYASLFSAVSTAAAFR